jgi:hypothetical protein
MTLTETISPINAASLRTAHGRSEVGGTIGKSGGGRLVGQLNLQTCREEETNVLLIPNS